MGGTTGQNLDTDCCVKKVQELNTMLNKETAKNYCDWINQHSYSFKVSAGIMAALIQQESTFNQDAVSSAGAIGLCQLMSDTAKYLGVDRHIAERNIYGGTKYININYKTFGKIDLALAAYNAGPGAVIKYGGIPPYPETQEYVRTITNNYNSFWKQCLSGITSTGQKGILDNARGELGSCEYPDGSNCVPNKPYNICDYWCASFAGWAYRAAGYNVPELYGAPDLYVWMKKNQVGFEAGQATPQPGDMMFVNSGLNEVLGIGHIGIVEAVNADGTLTTIEGNVGNCVKRLTRKVCKQTDCATAFARMK